MTKIDFTPAQPIDVVTLEREARELRAKFLRQVVSAAYARVATALRGAPAVQH